MAADRRTTSICRVKAVNRYGESDYLDAQKGVVIKDPFDKADRPGTPDIVDYDKDHADLKWQVVRFQPARS